MTVFYSILIAVCLFYAYFVVKAFAQEKPKKVDEVLSVLGVVTITWGIVSVFMGALLCLVIGLPVSQRYGTWELVGRSEPVEIFAFKTSEEEGANSKFVVCNNDGKNISCIFITKNKMGSMQKVEKPLALTSISESSDTPNVQTAEYKNNPPAWLGMGRWFAQDNVTKTELFIPAGSLVK